MKNEQQSYDSSVQRKWELIEDRQLDTVIKDFQETIEFYRSLYFALRSIGGLLEESENFIQELMDNLEITEGTLQPFLDERNYRDQHGICVEYEYRTPNELIENTKIFATWAGHDSLTKMLMMYRETKEQFIKNITLIKGIRDKSRKLGLIGELEKANASFLLHEREAATLDAQIEILEKEIKKRSQS